MSKVKKFKNKIGNLEIPENKSNFFTPIKSSSPKNIGNKRPQTPSYRTLSQSFRRKKIRTRKKSAKSKRNKMSSFEKLLADLGIIDYIGTLRSQKVNTITHLINLSKIQINNINMDSYNKYRLYRFIIDDWIKLYTVPKIKKQVIRIFNKTYQTVPKRNSLNIMNHVMKLVPLRAQEPTSPLNMPINKTPINAKPKYRKKLLYSFGVNNYKYWSKLSSAVNDAIQIDLIFKNKLEFHQTKVFQNEEFNKNSLEKLIKEELYSNVHPDDLVVITFHGHGHSISVDGKLMGFLVPPNAPRNANPSQLISTEDISNWSKYIPARHVLFIFDCCFSGLSVMRNQDEIVNSPKNKTKKSNELQKFYRKLRVNLSGKSRIIINAGLGHEKIADNIGGKNSALTHYIINSALIENGSSCSVHRLFMNILTQISNNHEQNPCIGYLKGHEGTDIFLGL
jgi:hypothetical protein